PWPDSTRRFGRWVVDSSIIAMRSSRVNMPCLFGLTNTATTTSSNCAAARSKMSTWPRVTGSKDPGHTAPLMDETLHRAQRPHPHPAPVHAVMRDQAVADLHHLDDVHLVAVGRLARVLPDQP